MRRARLSLFQPQKLKLSLRAFPCPVGLIQTRLGRVCVCVSVGGYGRRAAGKWEVVDLQRSTEEG